VSSTPLPTDLPARIKAWARECGFADAAIAPLSLEADRAQLERWLADGWHGAR